jgi:hypothetical protein
LPGCFLKAVYEYFRISRRLAYVTASDPTSHV